MDTEKPNDDKILPSEDNIETIQEFKTNAEVVASTSAVPFDPEPQRERIRGRIAQILLGMLGAVILLAFISVWAKFDAEILRTVLTIIFGPLVTLVSAATGFYYGSRASSR
jgi:hypothetical protein